MFKRKFIQPYDTAMCTGNAGICVAADMTTIPATVRHLIGKVRAHGHKLCTDNFLSSCDLLYMTKETQLLWDSQT